MALPRLFCSVDGAAADHTHTTRTRRQISRIKSERGICIRSIHICFPHTFSQKGYRLLVYTHVVDRVLNTAISCTLLHSITLHHVCGAAMCLLNNSKKWFVPTLTPSNSWTINTSSDQATETTRVERERRLLGQGRRRRGEAGLQRAVRRGPRQGRTPVGDAETLPKERLVGSGMRSRRTCARWKKNGIISCNTVSGNKPGGGRGSVLSSSSSSSRKKSLGSIGSIGSSSRFEGRGSIGGSVGIAV